MVRARDVMEPLRLIEPDASVEVLARTLLDENLDGLCVIDATGALRGVVTAMDLVYRDKRVHPPVTVALLDLVMQFGRRRTEEELHKIGARTVAELMTTRVVTATPDTPLEDLATWMVEKHISTAPVIDAGRAIGVVTKRAIVASALRRLAGLAD